MRRVFRFLKTPKGLLTILLVVVTAIAAPGQGAGTVALNMGAAVLAAGIVDLMILRVRESAWDYPSGAVLTAMIVTLVMRVQEPWYVPTIAAVVAVLSKYVLRTRQANVFNPAALALVLMFHAMPHGQNWWGALAEVSQPWLRPVLLVGGIYIAYRVNKIPLVLSFLGAYFCLFTATAFFGDPRHVAGIFRSPDVDAVLFFALVILTDPPTSPAKHRDQWVFGVIAAVVGYITFMTSGTAYYLLAGVLAANLWEAWRRVNRRSRQGPVARIRAFLQETSPAGSDMRS